jgi:hypothetical protein
MKFQGETVIGYVVTLTSKHLKCTNDPLSICEAEGTEGGLLLRCNCYTFFETEDLAMAAVQRHAKWAKGKTWAKKGTFYSIRPVVKGIRTRGAAEPELETTEWINSEPKRANRRKE